MIKQLQNRILMNIVTLSALIFLMTLVACDAVIALQGGVSDVVSSGGAFAVLKEDGSVVTWGKPDIGGDSSEVR